jgi:diadenosine tetraphosphatase ApaH/serine/threonine PP2A family protein phosphatase
VAKTRIDHATEDERSLRRRILAARAAGMSASLWHPDKAWALFRGPNGLWYPLTVCPELRTLRQLEELDARLHAWIEMLRMALRVFGAYRIGLDLNPANFGTESDRGRLFYIDDEVYTELAARDIAGAIVARIPEEPPVDSGVWRAWALELVATLRPELPESMSWELLCDEVRDYPVAEQFEERKEALLAVLLEALVTAARLQAAHKRSASAARVTCVIADVHANLPALEATLAAAKQLGADSYLFVGDVVGYGPHPAECIARLAELGNSILLRGNHDHAIGTGHLDVGMNRLARRSAEWTASMLSSTDLEWLRRLPVEYVSTEWMAVHGAPRDPRRFSAYVYELTYEENLRHLSRLAIPVCFYGHTHVQLVHAEFRTGPAKIPKPRTVDLSGNAPLLINPGSVGQPRDGDPRSAFAIWDRKNGRVSFHRASYDLAKTLRDLRALGLPAELDERLMSGS